MDKRNVLILFGIMILFSLFVIDLGYSGCCLDVGSDYYCEDEINGCDKYFSDDCPEENCTLGCCCNVEVKSSLSAQDQEYLGRCIYFNSSDEGGDLIFYSGETGCSDVCEESSRPLIVNNNLLQDFRAETVMGKSKIRVSWELNPADDQEVVDRVLHYCKVDDIDSETCIGNEDVVEVQGNSKVLSFNWDACYKFHLELKIQDDNGNSVDKEFSNDFAIACTGNAACAGKAYGERFCHDEKLIVCEEGNVIYQLSDSCDVGQEYCQRNSNPLGIFNQSGCDEDYKCFLDAHSSGIYNCYACSSEMECYDYKSQGACNSDSCKIGGCKWKSLINPSIPGINLGVCVDVEKSNCENCGSFYSSTDVANALESKSANQFVLKDCLSQLLNGLSVSGFECEIDPVCYEGGVKDTCNDYTNKINCEENTCNVGSGINCVWNSSSMKCGRDLNQDAVRDCRQYDGNPSMLESCEKDIYPPESKIIWEGGLSDLDGFELVVEELKDRREEKGAVEQVGFSDGDSLAVCNPYQGGTNFTDCSNTVPYASDYEEWTFGDSVLVRELISQGKLTPGAYNKFRYFAIDKHGNFESDFNQINLDLTGFEQCTQDVLCVNVFPDSDDYQGICSEVKKSCDIETGIFENTCEDALKQFKKTNPDFESVEESCDGIDNDCDGQVDIGKDGKSLKTAVCYYDLDGDEIPDMLNNKSFCNSSDFPENCSSPYLYGGEYLWDCNDNNGNVSPLIDEEGISGEGVCNDNLDNDCDGLTDEFDPDCAEAECDCIDNDGDGVIDEGCDDFDDDYLIDNGTSLNESCPEDVCSSHLSYCGPDNLDRDIDGDGIPNSLDRNDSTPLECNGPNHVLNEYNESYDSDFIGSDGLYVDDDNDGVCNGMDECPDTLPDCPAQSVNDSLPGCPIDCSEVECIGDPYCYECTNCSDCSERGTAFCTEQQCYSCGNCQFELDFVDTINGREFKFGNCSECPEGICTPESCTSDLMCNKTDPDTFVGVCSQVKRSCVDGYFKESCKEALEAFKNTSEDYSETENCDGLDNDCDGEVDEGVIEFCYNDSDGDGYGIGEKISGCGVEEFDFDCVEEDGDCNDSNPDMYPGAAELCEDGIDNDCNGLIDEFDAECGETADECGNCEDDDGDDLIDEGCPDWDNDTYRIAENGEYIQICDCFCNENNAGCVCGPDSHDNDRDGDGVLNAFDEEEDTPLECNDDLNEYNELLVSETGVALDDDGDGVCNYVDHCKDSIPDCPVENNLSSSKAGCPKDCEEPRCVTDPYCSNCKGDCEACGGGHWEFCTREVCESCDTNCNFTLVKRGKDGKEYGHCTTCAGEDCESSESDGCSDGELNNDETDVDCGGSTCDPCENGMDCEDDYDCESRNCNDDGVCEEAESKCDNGKKDSGETDVDCGGVCVSKGKKCGLDKNCLYGSDCTSSICGYDDVCVDEEPCENGEQDGSESDVDCGGDCDPCPIGKICDSASDCESHYCKNDICKQNPEGDADGDDMSNGWEEEHGLDPNNPNDAEEDLDGDGLTNKEEYDLYISGVRVDPTEKDTDGDGYSDKEEVDEGTDPTNPEDHPKGSPMVLILILLVLFIFLGVMLYMYFKGGKGIKSGKKPPKLSSKPVGPSPSHPIPPKPQGKPHKDFDLKGTDIFDAFESDIEKKAASKGAGAKPSKVEEVKKIKPSPKFTYKEEKSDKGSKAKTSSDTSKVEKKLDKASQSQNKIGKTYKEISKESSSGSTDKIIGGLSSDVFDIETSISSKKKKKSKRSSRSKKSKSKSKSKKSSKKSKSKKSKSGKKKSKSKSKKS